jgi:hypothetical protein
LLASAIDDIFWDVKEDVAMPELKGACATPLKEGFSCENIYFLKAAVFYIPVFRTIVRCQIDSFEIVNAIQQSLTPNGRLHFVRVGESQATYLSKWLHNSGVAVIKDMVSAIDMVKVCPSCFTPAQMLVVSTEIATWLETLCTR